MWTVKILLVLILLAFFEVISVPSAGQTLGTLAEKYEFIGIKNKDFKALAQYGKQRNLHWCWAACVQMVLNYNGVFITQEQIVKKCFGKLIDKPANYSTMFKALNGTVIDIYNKPRIVNSNNYPTSSNEIVSFLATKRPLIVGLDQNNGNEGHAYVLLGIYYEVVVNKDGNKRYKPHSVTVVDPSPGSPTFKDISWDEFASQIVVSYKVWAN